jgi:hypothetical protein
VILAVAAPLVLAADVSIFRSPAVQAPLVSRFDLARDRVDADAGHAVGVREVLVDERLVEADRLEDLLQWLWIVEIPIFEMTFTTPFTAAFT